MIELAIAWRPTTPLTWSDGPMVLNVRSLAETLRERFGEYEDRLKNVGRGSSSCVDAAGLRTRRQGS